MRSTISFIVTLWIAIAVVWVFSGEQFLDLVFAMPDAGPIDDWAIAAVVGLEETRALLDPPDLFSELRAGLHRLVGLN